MADVVDAATRSRMMAGIRSKDTKPEIVVRRYLHAKGLRFRLHVKSLPGRPDLVFPRFRTVVFVHGCFWHQHPGCQYATRPASRADYWANKLSENVARDEYQIAVLKGLGWRVLTIWECQLSDTDLIWLADEIRGGRGRDSSASG